MTQYAQTLIKETTADYQEKGSKFLAYAFPCQTIETFNKRLEALQAEHPKARHHCYAYRFGELGEDYRANDDGEPSGTAGLPIYNQLQSFEVSDCGLIVVRYFGGTLLGASGLIRAYKTAAQSALSVATFCPITPKTTLTVTLSYPQVNRLMRLVEYYQMTILSQEMAMNCRYQLEIERDKQSEIIDALAQQDIHLEDE